MELIWQPAQPAMEPVQALLEHRAQDLRDAGLSAPVLLGVEEGDPYACLDVVTDAGTYRVIVLAGTAGSGRSDYDALLFNLADATTPLLDRTIGPADLEAVIDELVAAIPLSAQFKLQAGLLAKLRASGGSEMLSGLLAAAQDSDDPRLAAARNALAQAQAGDVGPSQNTVLPTVKTPGRLAHFARLGSVLAAAIGFGLGLAMLALVSATLSSLAAGFVAFAMALVIFWVLEPSARQLVTMVRLTLALLETPASELNAPIAPPPDPKT